VRTLRRKALVLACAIPVLALSAPALAAASWSTSGSGQATGAADTMPAGTQPSGQVTRGSVLLSWAPSTFSDGQAVQGYEVSRVNAATGGSGIVGGTCSGLVTVVTCADASVPSGGWLYTVTPVQLSWTGAPGPASATVVVP